MDLVRYFAKDGVELVGLLYESNCKDLAVIHIHGWCGNFYENEFVKVVGNALSTNDIAMLAVNTRAHDYRCDLRIKTKGGFTSKTGGGAVDDFESSILDIDASIQYLKKLGYKRIVLQGHSTAAQKILNYALNKKYKDLILLSAGDINSEITVGNKNSQKVFKTARKMLTTGKGDQYLSEPLWGLNFTAQALIKGYGDGESCDLFPIRTGKTNPKLKNLKANILNVLGKNDQLLTTYTNAKTACSFFEESLPSANQKIVLLDDNHGFQKNPQKLAKVIVDWCKNLI